MPDFLHTAVPMYAAGAAHPYQVPCQWLMTEVASGRVPVVIAGIVRLDPIALHQAASQP